MSLALRKKQAKAEIVPASRSGSVDVVRLLDQHMARWQAAMEEAIGRGDTPAAQQALGARNTCGELKKEFAFMGQSLRAFEEELSGDEGAFEPWFRPRELSDAIQRTQTRTQRKRFALYFDQYGCIACQTKERPHAGNGFCGTCRATIQARLKKMNSEDVS